MEITKENIKELVGRRFVPNVKQDWEGFVLSVDSNWTTIQYSDEKQTHCIDNKTVINTFKNGDWILLPQEKTTQPHYDNTNGSLYLFAEQHKLNAWEFDILKRVVRCRKKGEFETDLKKTIEVINLYLKEYEPNTTTTN
jgi:hypothetical protein